MKLSKCFHLACYNVFCKTKYSLLMIKGILFIFTIILTTVLVVQGFQSYYNSITQGEASSNAVVINVPLNSNGNMNYTEKELLQKVLEIPQIGTPSYSTIVDVPYSSGNEENAYININRVTLIAGQNTYQGIDDKSFNFTNSNNTTVKFEVKLYLNEGKTINNNDLQEFLYHFPKSKLIVSGTEMQNPKEIMISDYMLSRFGVTDYNALIGKRITFAIDGIPYIKDFLLVGVINEKLYRISTYSLTPHILICGDLSDFAKFKSKSLFAYAPVDDFSNSLTVLQSLRQKNIENLVSYDADLAEQIFFISQLKSIVMYVMLILSIFVILAMSLSLFSVLYNYISSNSKYYAMVRAIGVKRQTIFTILFIELLLLLLVSMLFIVPISGLFLVILNYCLINIIAVGVPITLNQLLEAVFPMFLLFSIGIISISMILLRWNQRKEICIILKQ